MAIYHCSIKIIGRSSGRSSVAAAAYRAGEKLQNERDGVTHNYGKKKGIVHTEIMLPENAPQDFLNRGRLWNEVERAEKRKDAQTAREVEISIPIEFNYDEGIKVVREYVSENFVKRGMCADIAIHDTYNGNPHAHVLLTTRNVDEKGFKNKNREWNDKSRLDDWRKEWANVCNEYLRAKGFKARIDNRTLEAQGIDREPTIYVGVVSHQMEKRGISTERGETNKEIKQRNIEISKINTKIEGLLKQRDNMEIEYTKSNYGRIQTIETPQKAVDIRQYNRERQARILENLNDIRRSRPPREERNRATQETAREIDWDR